MKNLMERSLLAFVVTLFVAVAAHADVFKNPMDASRKPALTQVLSSMTSGQVTTGNFKQTKSIKKLNREFVSTGTFKIAKNKGIVWNTEKPFPSVMTIDDSGMEMQAGSGPKQKMSAKDNPVFAEFSRTIQSVFSGNSDELEKNFTLYFEQGREGFKLGLVPKETAVRNVIASIVLEGKNELQKVTILDGEQNPLVYEFTQLKHE